MDHHSYDSSKYRTPDGVPADIVLFTITSREQVGPNRSYPVRTLEVLLIQRKRWPFEGNWALPGGFSKEDETLLETARRELQEETGLAGLHIEHLDVYSKPGRDPRGWIISSAYFALVHEGLLEKRKAADDAADVRLFPVEEALKLPLAFDHRQIIEDALKRIRSQVDDTLIIKEFLPSEFTITELQRALLAVLPDPFFNEGERINFRRKVINRGIIEEVLDSAGIVKTSTQYTQKPTKLYHFTGHIPNRSIFR